MYYYHFAFNTLNVIYDESIVSGAIELDQPDTKIMKTTWNAEGIEVSSSKETDFWQIKVKIPVKNFGINSLTPGMQWRLNLCRERWTETGDFYSYAFPGGFNSSGMFETLEFK